MKNLFLILFLVLAVNIYAQNSDDNLNGKVFIGTATEITPSDVDRMPVIYNEVISFQNGKMICESFKKYNITESNYTYAVDERRMTAMKIGNINSETSSLINGENVSLDFKGNIAGDTRLFATLTIRYSDNSEMKFQIEAVLR